MSTSNRRLFTSESVTEGHPDKICDSISDSILDALLAADPRSRVAVETLITTGQVHIVGEVTTEAYADIPTIVRDRVLEIGYDSSAKGFDGASCGVNVAIDSQSPDIAQGVDSAYEARLENALDELDRQGAGDQGLMFGYACSDTPELMPLPIALAHRFARRLTAVRKEGVLPYLRPDGKTQVTIEYDGDRPVRLDTVVISSQHAEGIDLEGMLAADLAEHVVTPVLHEMDWEQEDTRLLINPTGRFVVGGPMGDAGLTGRKIIVDTYGGMARHGGGAFWVRTRRRWTARRRMRCGGWPRTSSRRVLRDGSRCRWPTPSVRRLRWGCSWRRSVPRRWTRPRSRLRSPRCSICGLRRLSETLICCGRSMRPPPPTDTSGALIWTCRGSAPTASMPCVVRPAPDGRRRHPSRGGIAAVA